MIYDVFTKKKTLSAVKPVYLLCFNGFNPFTAANHTSNNELIVTLVMPEQQQDRATDR